MRPSHTHTHTYYTKKDSGVHWNSILIMCLLASFDPVSFKKIFQICVWIKEWNVCLILCLKYEESHSSNNKVCLHNSIDLRSVYITRTKMTKISRIWVGCFLMHVLLFNQIYLKARSAISWIYIHKMLNGSQWSYISWSKRGTAMIWIFRQWEIDQLWTFMCCKLFLHFNASHLAMTELVSGTDNGKCLQKTFPIGKFLFEVPGNRFKISIRW